MSDTERTATAASPYVTPSREDHPLLEAVDLHKRFPVRGGVFGRAVAHVSAVAGVSLEIRRNRTVALVGESGCGKSTTGRLLLDLIPPTSGKVVFDGVPLDQVRGRARRELRRRFQIVFQDPYAALNPRMTIGRALAEPLTVHFGWKAERARGRVAELLQRVGLSPEHANRFPHEFSGGQRQRVGIARALALDPELVVLDEPVSALDVSIQAGVLNLLEELQDDMGLAYLFIAHDLSVVRHIADEVNVMYLGRIMERGTRDDVYEQAHHPYTAALLSAMPVPDPAKERARERIILPGDPPNPVDPPSGCRFRTRCWRKAELDAAGEDTSPCVEVEPDLYPVPGSPGHGAACHFATPAPVSL